MLTMSLFAQTLNFLFRFEVQLINNVVIVSDELRDSANDVF